MTLEFQKLRNRQRLIGVAAVVAAATAAGLITSGAAGASATSSPVLQTLTYTATAGLRGYQEEDSRRRYREDLI